MAKNIVVFSDGTGQRSGDHFDENRTNIYKLYRATKCGPDSAVDPTEQFAFYDPGIGTISPNVGTLSWLWAKIYNLICQATGLGLTRNIKDCYKAIVKVHEPGDRIFLFGFSRGAYTVRCLAAVLHFCGIPRTMGDGSPLRKDDRSLERLASEAVERVYQHVSWAKGSKRREDDFTEQRKALGRRFRELHRSVDGYPHFIGVFDTVATVANTASIVLTVVLGGILVGLWASVILVTGVSWFWLWGPMILGAAGAALWYLRTHFKIAFGLPDHPWWRTAHLNPIRMRFYDQSLNPNVRFARHALAIDEHRKDFDRVPWGGLKAIRPEVEGEPDWLQQVWFAGNHADVGGGYPEAESRLSDAALEWLARQATRIPEPLIVDPSVLRTYPDRSGMQHDETRSWAFRFARTIVRPIPTDAPLDTHVVPRFALATVLQLDEERPYRPENLRGHEKTSGLY